MGDPRRRLLGYAPEPALLGQDVADATDGLDRFGFGHRLVRLSPKPECAEGGLQAEGSF